MLEWNYILEYKVSFIDIMLYFIVLFFLYIYIQYYFHVVDVPNDLSWRIIDNLDSKGLKFPNVEIVQPEWGPNNFVYFDTIVSLDGGTVSSQRTNFPKRNQADGAVNGETLGKISRFSRSLWWSRMITKTSCIWQHKTISMIISCWYQGQFELFLLT